MSVANDVRSDKRVRSSSWRRSSGLSNGMAKITNSGAVSSTTSPSSQDVRSTIPAITRYASRAPTARVSTSVRAPIWSESPPATLSTSPVGTRCGSTWPIWVVLRVTSCIDPYIAISQERTTIV